MVKDNFYIYVDQEGKMPCLRHKQMNSKSHPYYVRYVGNRPVAYRGPLAIVGVNEKLYCYDRQEFVSADNIPAE